MQLVAGVFLRMLTVWSTCTFNLPFFFFFFSQVQIMFPSWKCFLEIYVQAVSNSLKLHDSWVTSNQLLIRLINKDQANS